MTAGALIIAAGFSRRFGSDKRLYELDDGEPLLVTTLRRYAETFPTVAVVLRSEDSSLARIIMQHLNRNPPIIIPTSHANSGMAASLSDGVRATATWDHLFVGLGDMPYVTRDTLRLLKARMIKARRHGRPHIVQPCYDSLPGHPVGFSNEFFSELLALQGDVGARSVIAAHSDVVERVDVEDRGVVADLDQPPTTNRNTS
jgi:molybdenum cofactor cytidylyltransferase